jgi:hypothetical protein
VSGEIEDEGFIVHSIDSLIDWVRDAPPHTEAGLCHGLTGALVVSAGLSRLVSDEKRLKKVEQTFDEISDAGILTRYPADLALDLSWLTGVAGILWAEHVVRFRPIINPLFPPDSKSWSPREDR